ncbi:hypothetical protein IRM71_03910 [Erwinia amylovora]|uniref:hypothetical protein n=1 Tax=Erwinia amylovora TaxID=552 RepID=UPI000C07E07E|nr:hypothetical protein [Erwinia amylovora]MBZ2400611.1 hypothetical protein [Erwinia amylovora]MBZ2404228.1 hypothetical protein [Erwinia amylovora]UDJ86142.1 hypothetical protein IRM68_13975 [Erwinia amylovora]UDJ97607.1 hypothetical protein IRM69_09920 [Erwinia amylovora]UDK90333.1 hypothetical protein IRM70_03915 [Erwinia amylovora]
MKKIKYGIALSMALLSFASFSMTDFSGKWIGSINDEDGTPYSNLSLKINQVADKLNGSYCYVTQKGKRIDCADDGEDNLHGSVSGDKANMFFNSTFGGKNGRAELSINHEGMMWKLVSDPIAGEFYAPKSFLLKKEDAKLTRMMKTRTFSTDSFTITIVNGCGDFNVSCQDVTYYGLRNKDNSQIKLGGRTIDDDKTHHATGAIFKSGIVEYRIFFAPPSLKVTQGNKVLVSQIGRWM